MSLSTILLRLCLFLSMSLVRVSKRPEGWEQIDWRIASSTKRVEKETERCVWLPIKWCGNSRGQLEWQQRRHICHKCFPDLKVLRYSAKEKQFVSIDQPALIKRYNNHMGGVDRMDQNVAAYRINVRTKKWWCPMFAFIIDVMAQNSWIFHRQTNGNLTNLLSTVMLFMYTSGGLRLPDELVANHQRTTENSTTKCLSMFALMTSTTVLWAFWHKGVLSVE